VFTRQRERQQGNTEHQRQRGPQDVHLLPRENAGGEEEEESAELQQKQADEELLCLVASRIDAHEEESDEKHQRWPQFRPAKPQEMVVHKKEQDSQYG
jgi:hypothetical protein